MCCFDSSLLLVVVLFHRLYGSSSSFDGLSCGKRRAMGLPGELATRREAATAGTIHPAPCPDSHELLQGLQPAASFFLPKRSSGAGTQAGRVHVSVRVAAHPWVCSRSNTLGKSLDCVWAGGCTVLSCRYGHDPEVESQQVLFLQPLKTGRSSTQLEGQATPAVGFPFCFHKNRKHAKTMKRSSSKGTLKLSALIKHSEDGIRQLINHTYATQLHWRNCFPLT